MNSNKLKIILNDQYLTNYYTRTSIIDRHFPYFLGKTFVAKERVDTTFTLLGPDLQKNL